MSGKEEIRAIVEGTAMERKESASWQWCLITDSGCRTLDV
jgi:hypothetical protein